MEIRRILKQKEINTIFEIQDDRLEKQIPCTKAEWVQWLSLYSQYTEYISIWGIVEDDKVIKYIVASNAVMPPISRSIFLIYQNFYSDVENGLIALDMVKDWGRQFGAEKMVMQTKWPRVNEKLGFEQEDGVSMFMEIK